MVDRLFVVLMLPKKSFISMLISTARLIGAASYESYTVMHTSAANTDISLARELQKSISDPTQAHGFLDNVKGRKRSSKQKWTDRKYHAQVKNFCHTYQLNCHVQKLSSQYCHLVVTTPL